MPTLPEPTADDVYPRVREAIAGALACDLDRVERGTRLIDDLGAESIDFLDILFRLERGFDIQIPQGRILDEARGELSEAEFEQEGLLTPAGLARLREVLSEVPAERFATPLRLVDVPRLFTVETFCKIVVRALAEKAVQR